MIIAIDFDNTWTEDPLLWANFATKAKQNGHTVIMATARTDNDINKEQIQRGGVPRSMPVVFSGGELKEPACLKAGYKVNVWIDDSPEMVREILIIGNDNEL